MSRPHQTRAEWISAIKAQIHPVGECMEWEGQYLGKTPMVYCPREYIRPGNSQGRHSLRSVLYTFATGERLPAGKIIRPRCWNERCVHEDHFQLIDRTEQSGEQSSRGELQTTKARIARTILLRSRSKLDRTKADAIKASTDSHEVEAARHGVSVQTITAIRRGDAWAEVLPAASVFTWGGGRP